jgi:hypothetical protein
MVPYALSTAFVNTPKKIAAFAFKLSVVGRIVRNGWRTWMIGERRRRRGRRVVFTPSETFVPE